MRIFNNPGKFANCRYVYSIHVFGGNKPRKIWTDKKKVCAKKKKQATFGAKKFFEKNGLNIRLAREG